MIRPPPRSPLFPSTPLSRPGSVGALAVAPSDPNIIYVGSGEGLQRPDLATGDGIYKSTAGREIGALQTFATILIDPRSEEHTSELQSQSNLVCRLLLEKKKK